MFTPRYLFEFFLYFSDKNSKTNSKFEKKHLYVELVETNPLMYNIKHMG